MSNTSRPPSVARARMFVLLLGLGLFASLFFVAARQSGSPDRPETDPIVFTFATVGDSRHDPEDKDITAQDAIWLQHTRVLARILREIEAQRPHALFFNGDMIHGYTTNRPTLDREYAYWRGMVAGVAERGICVLPVPGNHEVQLKTTTPSGKVTKTACVESEIAWRENMGDLILDTNRWWRAHQALPTAWDVAHAPVSGPEGIRTDQRQLSYSFDFAGQHFAVINTDAVGADSHAPVTWLAGDLAAAKARGVRRQFVFGHKMAFTYRYNPQVPAKGLDVFPDDQQAFWDLIEAQQATYFCGHEHIYNSMQPRAHDGGQAWQIIVGSGGSPFAAGPNDHASPNDRQYAWAFVKVFQSGRLLVEISGFDEHFGATRVLETIALPSLVQGLPVAKLTHGRFVPPHRAAVRP